MALVGKVTLCLASALALAGCVSRTSYQIISDQEAPQQTTLSIEVPATSTQQDMQVWANHLETIYKTNGKPVMIDFYTGGVSADHLIGTYRGGSVRRVHPGE